MQVGNRLVLRCDTTTGVKVYHIVGDTFDGEPVVTIERERPSGDVDMLPRLLLSDISALGVILKGIKREIIRHEQTKEV